MNERTEAGLSSAEFKLLHEALGVSTAFLAERIGVSSGRIWQYEATDREGYVPEHAAKVMRSLWAAFVAVAEDIEAAARESGVIIRPANPAKFERMHRRMKGWGALAQGLVIARAQERGQLAVEWD